MISECRIDRHANRVFARYAPCQGPQRVLETAQTETVSMHFFEWIFARFNQLDRYFKRAVVRVFDPFDGQFLGKNSIMFNLLQMYSRPFDSGQDYGTAGLGNLDRRWNRGHSFSSNVYDDIGAFPACQFTHPFDHVLIGKDCLVSAELASKREAMRALSASNDKHGRSSGL